MLAVELSTVYENHFALWHDLRKSDVCTNLKIFETYRKYRHVRIITKIYSETVFLIVIKMLHSHHESRLTLSKLFRARCVKKILSKACL